MYCTYEKRRVYVKRDVYMWKETYTREKKPCYVKRNLYMWNENLTCEKRRVNVHQNFHMRKETCVYGQKNYMFQTHCPRNVLLLFCSIMLHMKGSWRTYECVMSHVWMSHAANTLPKCHRNLVTRMNESWHGTHMNESWHTCEYVMAHIWMSHGAHMNESWHTYEWAMALIWMSHGAHMNATYPGRTQITHMNDSCLKHTLSEMSFSFLQHYVPHI